jgi:hypothetical protein
MSQKRAFPNCTAALRSCTSDKRSAMTGTGTVRNEGGGARGRIGSISSIIACNEPPPTD